jgi:hypothetical protein
MINVAPEKETPDVAAFSPMGGGVWGCSILTETYFLFLSQTLNDHIRSFYFHIALPSSLKLFNIAQN